MIVDSSVWIEIFREGPLSKKCEKAIKGQKVRVPSLVIFEVYKKIKTRISEEIALEVVGALSQYEVLDLTRETSLLAADLSVEHSLGMADSIVLAHARGASETLLTLDNDFSKIPSVSVIR
jgi:predicted nucleic acid-binding protein